MTSESSQAFVWFWMPGATEPVVVGRLDRSGEVTSFTYGRNYLGQAEAVPLYLPELPLEDRVLMPLSGMSIAGCIADSGPDAWGQRVIMAKHAAGRSHRIDHLDLGPLTFLLESGSDRIGALDFQASSTRYVARTSHATLDELRQLQDAATALDAGEVSSPELLQALLHGSSLGGARPKVLIDDQGRKLIAKFSRASDTYPMVKAEGVAMELARRCGLDVAPVAVIDVSGRDVLLVDRFDRTEVPGERRMVVSALTILELDERWARYATYPSLAEQVRKRFSNPQRTLRELFSRIVFNICVSNTDDHARNHAAFVEGGQLTLTPAFDVCPQSRRGGEAVQAMELRADGYRFSRLAGAVSAAPTYQLSAAEARQIVDHQVGVIRSEWEDAADVARLTKLERESLWGVQILNPYALEPEA
ncbi:MAG TPA: HipA domain-containing protein [Acidimicrobiales bacterium]